ncbi:MAG: DUF3987 domain-containing protein [bacterium]
MTNRGIDDALVAGIPINLIEGEKLDQLIAELSGHTPDAEQAGKYHFPETASQHQDEIAEDQPPGTHPSALTFPTNVFPSKSRIAIESLVGSMNCDPGYLGTSVLAVAGAAIGTTRCIKLKNTWVEYPSIYGMIIGQPGTLKSPSIDNVVNPVKKEQKKLRDRYIVESDIYNSAAIMNKPGRRKNQNCNSDNPPSVTSKEPRYSHLYASDTTTEALAVILNSNPRGILICRDEIAGWFKSMNCYRKGGDVEFYLTLYSSKPIAVDRKSQKSPLWLGKPFACVIGSIQPEVLIELKRNEVDNGFSDRFLYCFPDDQKFAGYVVDDVDPAVLEDWENTIKALYKLDFDEAQDDDTQSKQAILDEEAKLAFRNYVDSLAKKINDGEIPDYVRGFAEKLKGMVARIALIIHYLRWAEDANVFANELLLDFHDMQAACKLADYYLQQFNKVKGLMQSDTEDLKHRKIYDWMIQKGKSSFTQSDLSKNGVAGIKNASEAALHLRLMVTKGFGQWKSEENKSRQVFVPKSLTTELESE